MAEYIEREALLDALLDIECRGHTEDTVAIAHWLLHDYLWNKLKDFPAADVVEVRHGHWYFVEYEYFSCSECGESYYNGCDSTYEAKEKLRNGEYHNYCPNCGAKMDGKGEGNEIG